MPKISITEKEKFRQAISDLQAVNLKPDAALIHKIYNYIYDKDNEELFSKVNLNYPQINYSITQDEVLTNDFTKNSHSIRAAQLLKTLEENKGHLKNISVVYENPEDKYPIQKYEDLTIVLKTPLEKLFFALIWKNQQFSRFSSIVEGIKDPLNELKEKNKDKKQNEENTGSIEADNAVVFRQFGRYLANTKQPIIDQHVLRFYFLLVELNKDKSQLDIAINDFTDYIKELKGPNTYRRDQKESNESGEKKQTFKKGDCKALIDYGGQGNAVLVAHKNSYVECIERLKLEDGDRYKLDCIYFTLGKTYKNL